MHFIILNDEIDKKKVTIFLKFSSDVIVSKRRLVEAYLDFMSAMTATRPTATAVLIIESVLEAAASSSIFRKRSAIASSEETTLSAFSGTFPVARLTMAIL